METEYPWLNDMLADVGKVHEIAGAAANEKIIECFRIVGHPECKSDEIAWCAARQGAALKRAGFPIPPPNVNLMARSYCTYGVECEPRPGAIIVLPRGNSTWQGHVGTVVWVKNGRVKYVAGNQSDAVGHGECNVSDALAFRWPIAPTATELRQAGSTEIKAADTIKVGTAVAGVAAGAVEASKSLPDLSPSEIVGDLTILQQMGAATKMIGELVASHWYVAFAILAGLAWYAAAWIKKKRLERAKAGAPLSKEAANA